MKQLLVLLKLILIFECTYSAHGFHCICLKNKDYVNCGVTGLIENFQNNVAIAKTDDSQKLMTNAIPFDHVIRMRIECKITSLKLDCFQNQRPIKILDLSRNELSDLPTNIFVSTPFLEQLDISWNKFKKTSLDTFSSLHNLKELDASHNIISDINLGALDEMKKLEKLCLNGNKLFVLPSGVFDTLVNLRKLDISNNKLTEIELQVFKFTKVLQDLNLSENEFSSENALAGLESLTSIVNLNLSNCKISKLRLSAFRRLTGLQQLNLNYNPINALPKIFDAARDLNQLYMSHNRLTSIPPHLFDNNVKLDKVDWSYNQLKTLPDDVFNFTENFKYLNISHNAIDQLPLKIFQWSSLIEIDLSYNSFTTLEPELLNMETLERVHAQHNKISYLEDDAFSSCTFPILYINLQHNRLVYLPEYFFDWLANLETIKIFGNPWDCSCLKNLIKLLSDRFITYDVENYKTTKPICVAGENRVCQYYTTNLTYFYEIYKHVL